MFIVAEGKSAMKFDAHSVELDKDLVHRTFSCGSIPLPSPPPQPPLRRYRALSCSWQLYCSYYMAVINSQNNLLSANFRQSHIKQPPQEELLLLFRYVWLKKPPFMELSEWILVNRIYLTVFMMWKMDDVGWHTESKVTNKSKIIWECNLFL